jgi:hypothetical protein
VICVTGSSLILAAYCSSTRYFRVSISSPLASSIRRFQDELERLRAATSSAAGLRLQQEALAAIETLAYLRDQAADEIES